MKKVENVEDMMCKAIADMIEDGRTEGRKEGRTEGREEGEDLMAVFVKNLLKDSRTEELMLALDDKEVRKALYVEYDIKYNMHGEH